MIIVRLPSTLRIGANDTLEVHETVPTIGDLVAVLDRRIPGFEEQLADSVFNFAVNDEMLLHRARDRALKDGDIVEIVPTISGGDDEKWERGKGKGEMGKARMRNTRRNCGQIHLF